jgi:hypothetical protein
MISEQQLQTVWDDFRAADYNMKLWAAFPHGVGLQSPALLDGI